MTKRASPSPFPTARKPMIPRAVFEADPPKRTDRLGRLGEQIQNLRRHDDLAAGALARRVGVSRSMLSRIERGLVAPSIATLDKLAEGLGIPLSRLFHDPMGAPTGAAC